MRRVLVSICLAGGVASGAPLDDARDKHKAAAKLAADDDNEAALKLVDEGLALVPSDLPLLQLRGTLLLKTRDYAGALAAYQAYLDAGARGANKREALKILASLTPVKSTFIDLTANTDATIYLDTKSAGPFCTAPCNRALLPGDYKVIAERAGFERWTGHVAIAKGTATKLAVALVEKPSAVVLRVTPAEAVLVIDGAPYTGGPLPAGSHKVVFSLAGHATRNLDVTAHEGAPIELEVALVPLVPLTFAPAAATLTLDDAPAILEAGGIAVPPGPHVLVAKAPGFHEQKVEIPADRPAGYTLGVELPAIGTIVDVAGAPAGAHVLVDGKTAGTTPFATPLEVPVGTHSIEIKVSGYRPYRTSAAFGQDQRAHLRLGKLRRDDRRRTTLVAVGAGAALVAGAVFSGLALGSENDFETRARLAGVTPDDPSLRDAKAAGEHYSLAADIGFALAVAGLGVSAYLFTHEGRGWSEGSLQVGIGPGGAVASGRF